jgi:lipopolysaccharide export system ATP-binding protein
MSTLKTSEISKSYSGRTVVHDVSVSVEQGEVVGLLGPNGAGKTTTFYMIVGLISPDSGKILLDDEDITNLPMYRRAGRGISYLPQEASVFRKLTVQENLLAIRKRCRSARGTGASAWTNSSTNWAWKRYAAARVICFRAASAAGWRLRAAW